MAHASALCPFCGNESISMSSSVLAHKRRLSHVRRTHPDREFTDEFLKRKGETHSAQSDEPLF